MNFINALVHAGIGYGIRRKCWHKDAILHLDNFRELWWLPRPGETEEVPCTFTEQPTSTTLGVEDLNAKDWETV